MTFSIAALRSRLLSLFNKSPRDYYADPQAYWNERHNRFGTGLVGVGTIALREDQNTAEYNLKWRQLESALQPLRDSAKVSLLDAGCGNGYFSGRALALGFDVEGVDFSREAIAVARSQHPDSDFRWHIAALHEFDPGKRYDVVMSIDVLFHIVDDSLWKLTVDNLARLTLPTGALVIQEHFVAASGNREGSEVQHVHWRDLDRYLEALPGWSVSHHERYELPESHTWKNLVVFRPSVEQLDGS
jgi:2-polyprenyl-3-methyl-5-hydroxy-6-metoxy-1,4-benzoquinol methylase